MFSHNIKWFYIYEYFHEKRFFSGEWNTDLATVFKCEDFFAGAYSTSQVSDQNILFDPQMCTYKSHSFPYYILSAFRKTEQQQAYTDINLESSLFLCLSITNTSLIISLFCVHTCRTQQKKVIYLLMRTWTSLVTSSFEAFVALIWRKIG